MCTQAPAKFTQSATATDIDFLKHAVAVYEAAIDGDWHNQSREFHRVVLNDAKYALGDLSIKPSAHAKGVRGSCREVCDELHIICLSRKLLGKGDSVSGLSARKHAAGLLGIDYKTFKRYLAYA
jgi:hypothetical protein